MGGQNVDNRMADGREFVTMPTVWQGHAHSGFADQLNPIRNATLSICQHL
jgi:hypothetical protein